MYLCLNRGTAGGSLDFDRFVKLAADAGFAGADIDVDWAVKGSAEALGSLFQSHGLRFGGWGVPYDWRGDGSATADGIRVLDRMASIAAELGIDRCCTWLLPSSDRPFLDNWHFHRNRLKPVADTLAQHGLRLGLEFVSPFHLRRKFPHEFVFTPHQVLELAADIGENVGLLVDTFHCHASGTPWGALATIPASKIVAVHLNDVPRSVPLDKIEDSRRELPGDGQLDLSGFFGALRASGYDGPVSLEVFNEALRRLDPSAAARKACDATRRALVGVALE